MVNFCFLKIFPLYSLDQVQLSWLTRGKTRSLQKHATSTSSKCCSWLRVWLRFGVHFGLVWSASVWFQARPRLVWILGLYCRAFAWFALGLVWFLRLLQIGSQTTQVGRSQITSQRRLSTPDPAIPENSPMFASGEPDPIGWIG